MYNPITAGHASQLEALNDLIERASRNDLVRLNTYLRRYIAPQVTRELFLHEMLDTLLHQHQLEHIVALILDIRGFVRTTQAGEQTSEGLGSISNLLKRILPETIRIAFENRGLVGEFSGDRVMVTFGFPQAPYLFPVPQQQTETNIREAIRTALSIQEMVGQVKQNLDETLRDFDIGIGICAGGPAWIGNLDNEWRQELTVVSTAANIAARAEELTKKEELMAAVRGQKIIINEAIYQSFETETAQQKFRANSLGEQKVRGLNGVVPLYHLEKADADILPASSFSQEDADFRRWLTDYLDGAIERDVSLKVRQALSRVGHIIISDEEEVPVLEQVMDQIKSFFNAETASLYLVEEESGDLIFESTIGPSPPPPGTRLAAGTGIAGYVAESQEPFLSSDVHQDPRWYDKLEKKKKNQEHRSMMCVPLLINGKTIGVIQVIDKKTNAFSEKDLNSLIAFGNSATIAISNAQRYERESLSRRTQNRITEALTTSLDLGKVLDTVMGAVKEVLDPQSATLYLLEKSTGRLKFARVHSKSETAPKEGDYLDAGQGIAGWVAQTKQDYISADVRKDPHWEGSIGADTRSMLCVPLLANRQVVGVLQVIDARPGVFTDKDLDILKWLAASAAVAVDNAAKYEELEAAYTRYVAAETMAALGDIAGKLAHNLTNKIGIIEFYANMVLKDHEDPEVQEAAGEILESVEEAIKEITRMREPLSEADGRETDLERALKEVKQEADERIRRTASLAENMKQPSISINLELVTTPLLVQGGVNQVKYIFRNLIDNSVRAIVKKGEQSGMITLREIPSGTEQVTWIMIEVEDTGIGIPEIEQKRIFEMGYTSKPEGKVGGYGLFWVMGAIQRIGGEISVESKEGVGTKFMVKLPLVTKTVEEKG